MFGPYHRRLWIGLMLIGLLAYVILDSRLVKGEDAYAAVERSMEEYAETLKVLTQSYFKTLETEDLTTSAIEGMLGDLDPYTQYLGPKALEQLRIETQGKFGGLGITISLKNKVPVVMSVIEGTPADTSGLVVGDRIVKVEGQPTAGKTLQDVVDVLRGTPGTEVRITLDRPGRPVPFDQAIIRARIRIESVRVAEEIEPGIGYISMSGVLGSRFSETTPRELDQALRKLKAQNVRGMILDLRENPGGLLNQAVAVADKFLGKGRLVVTTRGRMVSQNEEYRTEEPSLIQDTPLVVLVNRYSASASEIVAGAIQDSDRGLILGTPTFGKGSVQTIRYIGRNKGIKLTTAAYYTPSGRSIQSTDAKQARGRWRGIMLTLEDTRRISAYQVLRIIGEADRREDALAELRERFDLNEEQAAQVMDVRLDQLVGLGLREQVDEPEGDDPEKAFKTAGGRTVYGGGGITPDVKVEPTQRPGLLIALGRAGLFFDFAVDYAATHSFPETPEDFTVDEEVVKAFRAFLADTSKTGDFRYQTLGEVRLRELEETLEASDRFGGEARGALERLRGVVGDEREAEFEKAKPYIRLEIERELANRVWGDRAKLLASLKGDKQFQEAVRILKDPELYKKKMNLTLVSRE